MPDAPLIRITINGAVDRPSDLTTWSIPDFSTLYDTIAQSAAPGSKTDSDLLVPVAEWGTLHRHDRNAVMMSRIFVADVDGKTDATMVEILDRLIGRSHIGYTTHSHGSERKGGLHCYRIILELDREYPPAQHLALWDKVNVDLGGHLDPSTRKITLGYYLPSYPEDLAHLAEHWCCPGETYKVPHDLTSEGGGARPAAALTGVRAARAPPPTQPAPSPFVLENTLAGWRRQCTDAERRAVAGVALDLLRGKCSIELHTGQRNAFLTSLSGYLAAKFPHCPPEGIAVLFEGIGWDLFTADGKYPLETLGEMIERFQAKELEARYTAEQIAAAKQAKQISRATGGEREHPITDEEITAIEDKFGPQWRRHLIASRKRDLYFLRVDGTYDPDPIMREMIYVAARDRLAVFGDCVEYTYEDEKGVHRKTPAQFLEDYATVVRHVAYDMGRPEGSYDPETQTVYLPAAAPIVDAVEHPEVHRWLESLGDHLIDMIAAMPMLHEAIPALVMTGQKRAGKTILALGLGQIYGRAPTDAEEIFTQFNAALFTKQPIVFMDEKAASAYKREGTTLVRKFVTQGVRWCDEKYQARVELIGFPRLVVAANNLDVLATAEDMSAEDRAAYAERLVHIDMDPGRAYLPPKPVIQRDWLDGRWLAEHFLWLSQNWTIKNPGNRFIVMNNHTELHSGLASKSGSASDVACWLLRYVANPATGRHLPIELIDGKLRVNSGAVMQGWSIYLEGHRPPSPHKISRAIASLSSRVRQKIRHTSGGTTRQVHAYEIDPYLLRSANDIHGLVDDFDRIFNLTKDAK